MRRLTRAKLIADTKRLVRLEQLVLRGITNQYELAAAFGMKQPEICYMLKYIREQWIANDVEDVKEQVLTREKQLEALAQKALTAFDRSRMDTEEFVTVERVCNTCKGEGKIEEKPDEWERCADCQGMGKTQIETTKVKGQAGDPAFLRIAKECFVECARLKGLYPQSMGVRKIVKESKAVGGEIQERVEELYLEAPDDKIIKALQALDDLQRSIEGKEEGRDKGYTREGTIYLDEPRDNVKGANDDD